MERFDFRNWILNHQSENYEIKQESRDVIYLVNDYGEAKIVFTEIEESEIIEFTIVSNKDQSVKFYLHFELNDEEHAKGLYDEMVETLSHLKDDKTVQVLLSCSSGLTTSMFAQQLNSTVELLGIDYHFDAVAYTNIYDDVEDYDAILIAPQIGYMLKRLKESLPNKLVEQIPTAAFASYDSMEVIQFVQREIDQHYQRQNEIKKDKCVCCKKYEKRILSISIVNGKSKTNIDYRLYDGNEVIESNRVIKCTMDLNDLCDIIDTMLLKYKHIDMIGIATPGIVKDQRLLVNPLDEKVVYKIKEKFEMKYQIDVFVYNSANAAAVGFSLEHPEYQNLIFLSQAFGYAVGGLGILVNGKVVNGKSGIAGEVKYFIRRMQLSDEPPKLVRSEQGALEMVSKELLAPIVTLGPDAVAVSSTMTPNMEELKEKLSSFIPDEFLPELFYIEDASPYMLDGITQLCMEYIYNQKEGH